jgi:hypothetical protein
MRNPAYKEDFQPNHPDVISMQAPITTKGGIRNKKVIAVLEKFVYPDVRNAITQVSLKCKQYQITLTKKGY